MTHIPTKPIPTEATHHLRDVVMGQGKHAVKPGDDAPNTLHAGAYKNDNLVAIASVYHEAAPGSDNPTAWRLRGMASLPEVRGEGYGRAALELCMQHIAAQGGTLLWCNARKNAVGFYKRMGFVVEGDEFIPPGGIPHYFMWREITPESAI